jgi:uncharacterized glyoxalase superfamily protein PhnB
MEATDTKGEPAKLGEFNGFEIYPMPMFATLSVADVTSVTKWYEAALGFGTVFAAPGAAGQPSLVHLRRRKYQDLLITPSAADGAPPANLTLTFNADGELDAIAARAREAASLGHSAVVGPVETPWNTRDLRVTDPVGNKIVFTSRNENPDPAQMERFRKMFEQARG